MDVQRAEAWRRLAERQHALVTVRQLADCGLTEAARRHLEGTGELVRCGPGVLRLNGSPATLQQELARAVLGSGRRAALHGTSALAHWGVRGFRPHPIHVVRHRDEDDHPLPGVRLHEVRALPEDEVRVLEGIRLVSPALALLQVAGSPRMRYERLAVAVDNAWSDRYVSFASLDAILARMSQRGRRGLGLLRAVLEERGPDHVPPASGLERRLQTILADADLPEFRRQVDTGDGEGWIGRVDFRAVGLPMIIEAQSERFHASLTARRRDRERIAALRAAGYVVAEVTDVEVFHEPWVVVERVRAGITDARRRAA